MKEIIVISEGNEVSYAKPFIDLFRIQIDNNIYTSIKGTIINPELYSKQVYLNSIIPKESFRLIVGSATVEAPTMRKIYNSNGMNCYLGDHFAKIFVDATKIAANYDSVFSKLIQIENEYFEAEAEYVKKCELKRSTYISSDNSSFLKRRLNDRIVQAYAYLAFHFYLYDLSDFIKD